MHLNQYRDAENASSRLVQYVNLMQVDDYSIDSSMSFFYDQAGACWSCCFKPRRADVTNT